MTTCHLCRRDRPARALTRVADGRLFCRLDVVGCLYAARIALGIPRWQAAKAKGSDVERMRAARRAA